MPDLFVLKEDPLWKSRDLQMGILGNPVAARGEFGFLRNRQ